jgi:hypothetical protein
VGACKNGNEADEREKIQLRLSGLETNALQLKRAYRHTISTNAEYQMLSDNLFRRGYI